MIFLLVDDQAVIREVWRRMLENSFTDIREAEDLPQALEQMQRLPHPDVVFLDVVLPNVSRAQHLAHIQELRLIKPDVIILILSGLVGLDEYAPLALAAGADAVADKRDVATQGKLFDAIRPHLESRPSLEDTLRLMEATSVIR